MVSRQPKEHVFLMGELGFVSRLVVFVALWVGLVACRSAPKVGVGFGGGGGSGAPGRTQRSRTAVDADGLPLTRLSTAPLRDDRVARAGANCEAVYHVLAAEPRRLLPIRRLRWEARRSDRTFSAPGAIRSYSYSNLRLTERIVVANRPRLFGVSFVNERHAEEWPFKDHLTLYRLTPSGQGCTVKISTFFNAPFGLSSFRARKRLQEEILPAIQSVLEKKPLTVMPLSRSRAGQF